MKRYEYQVSFFLNKEQNKAFTEYCISKNVATYIAGRNIVRDFMMPTEDAIEQTLVKDDHEDRIGVMEDRIGVMEDRIGVMVEALRIQVEKCEKLTEEISSLQDELTRLGYDDRLHTLEVAVDSLTDEHYELKSKVD